MENRGLSILRATRVRSWEKVIFPADDDPGDYAERSRRIATRARQRFLREARAAVQFARAGGRRGLSTLSGRNSEILGIEVHSFFREKSMREARRGALAMVRLRALGLRYSIGTAPNGTLKSRGGKARSAKEMNKIGTDCDQELTASLQYFSIDIGFSSQQYERHFSKG